MKRYWRFANAAHYPGGGWRDFAGSFDTVADAVASKGTADPHGTSEWWHVVDSHTGEIVAEG